MIHRFREIVTPNEQSIKLHAEVEYHKNIINRLTIQNEMYEERINQLNNFIKKLKRELIKLRVLIKNPINFNTVKQLY